MGINDLTIIDPHPVGYKVGIWKELQKISEYKVRVVFRKNFSVVDHYDSGFKTIRKHEEDLLSGYDCDFEKNIFKVLITVKNSKVVLIHGSTKIENWIILLFAKFYKTKVFFRGEATLLNNKKYNFIFKSLKFFFLKVFLKNCDIVFYSCSGNKNCWKYYKVEDEKMFPIPCAVDNEYFQKEKFIHKKSRRSFRSKLGINDKDFVIINVSRMDENKNLITLVQCLKKNKNKNNIHLLLLGDGIEKNKIKKFCKENGIKATFPGFMHISEVSKYYLISDLYVLLSKYYDYSPKALNEAMNFSLPVIVSNVAGTAQDLVAENENGFIVDPLDINLIKKRISYIYENRKIALKMGDNSFEIVNKWTYEKDAYWINKAIKKVLKC